MYNYSCIVDNKLINDVNPHSWYSLWFAAFMNVGVAAFHRWLLLANPAAC